MKIFQKIFQSAADAPRIGVDDLKRRLESGEPVTVLDARNQGPWQSSPVKIVGAIRWTGHIGTDWPKDRLTVVY